MNSHLASCLKLVGFRPLLRLWCQARVQRAKSLTQERQSDGCELNHTRKARRPLARRAGRSSALRLLLREAPAGGEGHSLAGLREASRLALLTGEGEARSAHRLALSSRRLARESSSLRCRLALARKRTLLATWKASRLPLRLSGKGRLTKARLRALLTARERP